MTPRTAAYQASLSITNFWSLLKLTSIKWVMPSNHLILCHAPFLPSSIFPSIRVFSNESVLFIKWLKYWSFSFSISPSNEYSGLISFRMEWLDILAVQDILKSLLQHIIVFSINFLRNYIRSQTIFIYFVVACTIYVVKCLENSRHLMNMNINPKSKYVFISTIFTYT